MFAYAGYIRKYARRGSLAIICLIFLSSPAASQVPVSEIVLRSSQQTKRYSEEFKNLLAKETKTIRLFDKNGRAKKERVIVSNFLVHEFLKGKGEITEFRSVLSVDGKAVANIEKRAIDLFERVSKAESSAGQLARIQKESLRYDDEIQIIGLTLFQGIALDKRVRESFAFEVTGQEKISNSDAYVLQYKQVKDSDLIRISDEPGRPAVLEYDFDLGDLKNVRPRLKGTLWIDRTNYQILREIREFTLRPEGFERPVVIAQNEFEYFQSDFGIHTPRRIIHTQFWVDPRSRRSVKEIEFQFVYSDFTRPKVEVTSDKPAQPR